MIVARWQVQARFGHKEAAIALMRRWWREIAPQVGWRPDQVRMLSGSVGERESAIDIEVELRDLAALQDAWSRLARVDAQAAWAVALEPHVVSGTSRWTIHRIV